MRRLALTVIPVLATLLCAGLPAFGQATTGSISGRVRASDGQPLPGVMVATTSPMLQGVLTAITSESGDYLIPLLPPGTYAVTVRDALLDDLRMQSQLDTVVLVAGQEHARGACCQSTHFLSTWAQPSPGQLVRSAR